MFVLATRPACPKDVTLFMLGVSANSLKYVELPEP
jgi:hypothetical protein